MNRKDRRQIVISKWRENPLRPRSLLAKDLKIPRSSVDLILKNYFETLSIEKKPGSGRPAGPSNPELERNIINTFRKKRCISVRDVAKKCKTNESMVQRAKQRAGMKTFKKQKVPRVSEKQRGVIKTRARKLYDFLGTGQHHLVIDDETYVKADFAALPGPQYYTAADGEDIPESEKTIQVGKFDDKYLVWQAICECGERSSIFVTKGTINKEIYIEECIKKRLLPFLRKHDIPTLFWPDLAPAHYAKDTTNFLTEQNVQFVPKEMNPPNVPQCRPIEHYWALVKGILRKTNQVAQNLNDFRRKWNNAAKKVKKESVKADMENIRAKLHHEFR